SRCRIYVREFGKASRHAGRATKVRRRLLRSAMSSDFSKRLIELMRETSLTVRSAAEIAGVPVSTLQDWRAGRSPTNFLALKALCKEFGVSLSYLLTGEEDTHGNPVIPSE